MPRSPEAQREYMRNYMRDKRAAARGESALSAPAGAPPKAASKTKARKPPAPSRTRRHRDAVGRMLRATGLMHIAEEAPLVQLVKDLALELDEGGGAEVYSKYLAALKDVRRVLTYNARPKSSSDTPPPPAETPAEPTGDEEATPARVNSLAKFKERKGVG